jgi:hypothetical protein
MTEKPKQPEQKLSTFEKIKLQAAHEANYKKAIEAMHKKFTKISKLTQNSNKLSTELGINAEDVKKYAKKSPDFRTKMKAFNSDAYSSFTNFRDYYKHSVEMLKYAETKTQATTLSQRIKENVNKMRDKTYKRFSKIKSSMSDSVKEMIDQERTRVSTIKDYEGLADAAVAHLPKKAQGPAKKEIMLDLQYQDTLAILKTGSYKEVSEIAKSGAQKKMLNRLKHQIDAGSQPDVLVQNFAKVRLEREQLKAQLKALDPKTDFVLYTNFPKKYSPGLNDRAKNRWTLDMPITNSFGITSSPNILKTETANLKNQVDALKIMIASKKADKMLRSIYVEEYEIADKAGNNTIGRNFLQKVMKYPKSINNKKNKNKIIKEY